ncbi:MAG: MetQ/NlpA family ABC transporter substrate-binding protein [Oscillibacter ruminantium]|uniref:MetQ/NlpA family ABC transporter substrate-binding protein n=1 Tax=Oscillibacter ruminantium TaxID=1263547 RepID=UPI002B210B84|nr:MetQ/NlpA family ABC transporter substrate-binding protein [Oscillibacter ruminantium]MEA5042735.1 MetQ/NlpA family ABC transporter substrate-binding protein [Oscillibacter ruminantium]
MNKKLFALALALGLTASLAACGSSAPAASGSAGSASGSAAASTPAETVTLKVAASPTPHAEILNAVKGVLAEQGIDLQITEYGDYVVPNTAVEEGDEDANYFQHQPYLDNFNAENGTHLVSAGGIHIEPMGVYAGKTTALADLPDGATIAIPNDATNEGRALLLLEAQGLIKLKDSSNLESTPNDIAENSKNLQFKELEAAMIPNTVEEVDLSVINCNYALQAGFNPVEDALAIEDSNSPYVNIIAVKEGHENDPAIVALVAALQSETAREFITSTYNGAVVPAF